MINMIKHNHKNMETQKICETIESEDSHNTYTWVAAAPVEHFPKNAGACVRHNGMQIAVFNFSRRNEWYACQNLCPHKKQMILSRGMIGSAGDEPKVACPFHKRTFSLRDGKCLSEAQCDYIQVFPVRVENGMVMIGFRG